MGGPGSGKTQGTAASDDTILPYNGERLSAAQWARRTGLLITVILKRLERGWSIERTLTTPARKYKKGSK